MTEEQFDREVTKAKILQQLGDRPAYWAGYITGLEEVYYGRKFATDEERKQWLAFRHDAYETNREFRDGYRDGLKVWESED